MMGLFCNRNFKNDEDYKNYVKRRICIFTLLALLGLTTFVITLLAKKTLDTNISDSIIGFGEGLGTALFLSGTILGIRNRKLLKDNKSLRLSRIEASDERNIEISNSASKAAMVILLVSMYIVMIVGLFWYPIVCKVISVLICLFIVAYLISYKFFQSRI